MAMNKTEPKHTGTPLTQEEVNNLIVGTKVVIYESKIHYLLTRK